MAWDRFTTLGALLSDLEIAWQDRLKDAEAALKAKRPAAAITDGLYALEIRLKVLICKRLELDRLPRAFEIHDLDALLLLAGLRARLADKKAAATQTHWEAIGALSSQLHQLRYAPNRRWRQAQAETFLRQLRDQPDGVLPWLSKQR
jgi:hypothetical protein